MMFLAVSLAFLASTASALGQSDLPPVTLVPAHPPGHDAYDLDHLVPDIQQSLHFRESGMSEEDTFSFGNINSTFNHPTVLLDHSSHVESVTCSYSGNLNVCFANKEAKDHARENWGNALDSSGSLVFSTDHPGCSGYNNGARGYWMASSADFGSSDNSCVHVNSTEVPLDEAMDNFELEFGQKNNTVPDQDAQQSQSTSSTVDITDDPEQLADFFQYPITETYPDVPETTPLLHNGTAVTVTSKRAVLYRRNIFDEIGKAWNKAKDTVVNTVKKGYEAAKKVIQKVIDFGKDVGKFIQDPQGFTWDLGVNVQKAFSLGAPGSFKHPTKTGLFGGEGIAIKGNRALPVDVTCDNCYAHGDIRFGGRIEASVRDGVKAGHVGVAGKWNSRLALAMKFQGQYSVKLLKQELLAVNLVELQIPGFLSVGPQVSVSAEVDLSFHAEADILVGATLDMKPSFAQLDFIDKRNNQIYGFHPELNTFAKFRGEPTVDATLDFGLPLGLEFGVDVLNGKWKHTVGVFDQPSFAVTAKPGPSGCSNGIQIGLSIDNEVYADADLWKEYKYTFRKDNIYEKQLACIEGPRVRRRAYGEIGARAAGNDTNNDADDTVPYDIQNPRAAVNRTFPDGVLTQPPRAGLTPSNSSVPQPLTKFVYNNVITDLNKTAVLFAGKEDRLYLGPYGHPALVTGTQFASQPNASESIVVGDVFGGYINYSPVEMSHSGVSNLRSSRLTNVPKGSNFIALAEIRSDQLKDLPGMYVGLAGEQFYALATCKVIEKGTRMYIVNVNTDGMDRLNKNELVDSVVGGRVEECQYAYLTSGREGLELGGNRA